MGRIKLVLAALALVVAMMAASAVPAVANTNDHFFTNNNGFSFNDGFNNGFFFNPFFNDRFDNGFSNCLFLPALTIC